MLIISVLLQPGKADAGALFSSSVSSTAFGPRGTQTLLAKITIGAAAVFMLSALTLALPALTQTRSVLETTSETAPAQQQPTAAPNALPTTAGATTTPAEPSTAAPAQSPTAAATTAPPN